jgi:hypothetical protein
MDAPSSYIFNLPRCRGTLLKTRNHRPISELRLPSNQAGHGATGVKGLRAADDRPIANHVVSLLAFKTER